MATVTVSFKQTTKDMKLYTAVNSLEEKSVFIKDAIEFYIKHLEEKERKNVLGR